MFRPEWLGRVIYDKGLSFAIIGFDKSSGKVLVRERETKTKYKVNIEWVKIKLGYKTINTTADEAVKNIGDMLKGFGL